MHTVMPKKISKIIIGLLFLCLFISGCFNMNIKHRKHSDSLLQSDDQPYYLLKDENGNVTDISLVSAFVDVINQNADLVEVYMAIPERYRENISLHDFTIYLNIMKNNRDYQVVEFTRLNDKNKTEYISGITTDIPSFAILAKQTEYYKLSYQAQDTSAVAYNLIVGIQHDSDGNPYLSAEWIHAINHLFEFSQLYFEAIDKSDSEMLTWLLSQGHEQTPIEQMLDIEKEKAALLINYYRLYVKTSPEDSVAIALLPNSMTFMQALEMQDNNEQNFRSCSFEQKNNIISVSDPYPERMKSKHLNIYYKDEFLLSWSNNGIRQTYYSYMFNEILGEPAIIKTNLSTPSDDDAKYWRITYPEISFVIKGEADNKDKMWSGVLERIEMNYKSQNLSLGEPKLDAESIYIGMPVYDFYEQYPFSPESDYVIFGYDQSEKMEMVVQVDNEQVQSLILRSVY